MTLYRKMESCVSAFALLIMIHAHQAGSEDESCSRVQSRVAHSILEKTFLSIMGKEGLQPGAECPLRPDRNMYWDNERHKVSEASSNWHCLYCGKTFYSEKFLDKHFVNRHRNTISQSPEAVCLADHCDYLRCDVISNAKTSSYWEEALCNLKKLEALYKKCEDIMKACIPQHVTGAERFALLDELKSSICSYLTCEQYWENPHREASPQKTAAYIIATVFMVFGFVMYYTLACSHLYSDDSLLAVSDGLVRYSSRNQGDSHHLGYPPMGGHSIRNRSVDR